MIVETPEPVLGWWSPDPRGILPLEKFRATKSLRQSAKRFEVRVDTSFERVIRACANPARPKGWITEEFVDAYSRLHTLGWAHSIEVFDHAGELAGGLYGVKVDRLFAGESMFFHQRDGSKVALMALVELMRETGMMLLDIQWLTEHLATLGAVEVSRRQYSGATGRRRGMASSALMEAKRSFHGRSDEFALRTVIAMIGACEAVDYSSLSPVRLPWFRAQGLAASRHPSAA